VGVDLYFNLNSKATVIKLVSRIDKIGKRILKMKYYQDFK